MSLSMDSLRNSMVKPPDPGTNFANSMEDYASVTAAGTRAAIDVQKEPEWRRWKPNTSEDPDFAGYDRDQSSSSFFLKRSPIQAFKVIETELSFVYEALYTKSSVLHTVAGPWLRFTSFFSVLSAFMLFLFTEKHGFEEIDIIITCTLLVVALVLEIYSVALLAFSDWAFTAPHFQLRLRCKLFPAANQQPKMV
ncbi:hypothetical protein MUK42_35375 [Musa troglodytarum]|uniref:DUF4220 domain-containing protein n=1 Tax=Musa troglodytarum TaxID=320322 RepID=A0A9E7JC25_9LILI|nr:hypothetical protein MUK42_35375 [Musa troglodytarum]